MSENLRITVPRANWSVGSLLTLYVRGVAGCGFVTFTTPEAAGKAIMLNGEDFHGRPIKCELSQGRPQTPGKKDFGKSPRKPFEQSAKPPNCTTIFFGNLSYDIDDDAVKDFFKDCGEVKNCRWLTDRESGQFKGCGFIEVSSSTCCRLKAQNLTPTLCFLPL